MANLLVLAAGFVLIAAGMGTICSCSCGAGHHQPGVRVLSPAEAAQLAAKLANDECERLYQRRPFDSSQHAAVLRDGEYLWGGLDVGGPAGFSARVTFRQDGSKPKVEVFFSSDQLRPASGVAPKPNIPKP